MNEKTRLPPDEEERHVEALADGIAAAKALVSGAHHRLGQGSPYAAASVASAIGFLLKGEALYLEAFRHHNGPAQALVHETTLKVAREIGQDAAKDTIKMKPHTHAYCTRCGWTGPVGSLGHTAVCPECQNQQIRGVS